MKVNLPDVVYHIGYRCNLSCKGCVNYSNHLEAHKLPHISNWHEEILKLSERFDVGIFEIIGGEPLQHPDVKEIISLACELEFEYVVLATNGLLLGDNIWLKDLLKKYNNFHIKISYHHDPMTISKYNNMMTDSLSTFYDLPVEKIKTIIKRIYHNKHTHKIKNITEDTKKVFLSLKDRIDDTYTKTWRYPELQDNEIPVQYNNDPVKAWEECICPWTHYLDGKLFKCGMTATLPQVIKLKDDIDKWPLLRDYQPYDVEKEHDQNKFETLRKPEDICKYCPVNNDWQYDKTDDHSKIIKALKIDK